VSRFPLKLLNLTLKMLPVELSVSVTSNADLLEIELVTMISSKSRVCLLMDRVPVGQSVGGISEMDSSDWSNGI